MISYYAFEKICKKTFERVSKHKAKTYLLVDEYVENLQKKLKKSEHVYVKIIWETDCENPAYIANDLLFIATTENVKQYCVFYSNRDIVIVATYKPKRIKH